uniref:filamin-binding LIM protein 1 n=1 Tax=Doryrhamphus excisus TaxID=161450 RepID=UPI0025AE2BED|nr:filamin-binding LIM protein 1 [Doryrhamphus excisus]XP_057911571.1 filamin-binding LIM protein 1 [Doryrhamphus excisus]XP_057911572.1 filamin-binding LIM protein 1 [Doryrhamphus excisus]
MASEESNRKVSSVFITLTRPHQTNIEQQQGPKKGWVHAGPSPRPSLPGNPVPTRPSHTPLESKNPANPAPTKPSHRTSRSENLTADAAGQRDAVAPISSSTSPPFHPPAAAEMPSNSTDPVIPPPPPSPVQKQRPVTSQQPPNPKKEEKTAPSSGTTSTEQSNGVKKDNPREKSRGACAFCRKPILFSEEALTALQKLYHKGCFRCRSCSSPLAGKQFYHEAEIPKCEKCHEASLEICWSCGHRIKGKLVRALQRTYHPACFTCVTCKQPLENFIQADTGELYCCLDYNRKHAKKCVVCQKLLIDSDGSLLSYITHHGRPFHRECFSCEVCGFKFSTEEGGDSYFFNGKTLCLVCIERMQN